jgi:hypothetical protein
VYPHAGKQDTRISSAHFQNLTAVIDVFTDSNDGFHSGLLGLLYDFFPVLIENAMGNMGMTVNHLKSFLFRGI